MFCIALATPLVLISFSPGPQSKISRDLLAKSGPFGSDARPATRHDVTRADRRFELPGVLLAATTSEDSEAELGLLGRMIGDNAQTHVTEVQSLRRLILDAVAVDLETEDLVDELQSLKVPVTDCEGTEGSTEGDLITNGAEIIGALRSLGGEPTGWMTTSELRLPGDDLALSGLQVEFCPDSDRIAAIEILPVEPAADPERGEELVSEKLKHPTLAGDDYTSESPKLNATAMSRPVTVVDKPSLSEPEIAGQSRPDIAQVASAPGTASTPSEPSANSPEDAEIVVSENLTEVAVSGLQDRAPSREQDRVAELPAGTEHSEATAPKIVKEVEDSVLLTLNGGAYLVSQDMPLTQSGLADSTDTTPSKTPQDLELAELETSRPKAVMRADGETVEEDLALSKGDRWNAQLRLALLGIDPKGIDGVFGPGTRMAIAELQEREALPPTGYLDMSTLAMLKEKSQPAYKKWRADRRTRRARLRAERIGKMAPEQVAKLPSARRAGNCSRDQYGSIIQNQSFDCDVNILKESLDSLFDSSS